MNNVHIYTNVSLFNRLLKLRMKTLFETCMEKFVVALEVIARHSVPEKPSCIELTRDVEDDKIIDSCCYSRKFLGFVHSQCNHKRKTTNFIQVTSLHSVKLRRPSCVLTHSQAPTWLQSRRDIDY